ncbi:MAG: DnaJ domain-containing protein [Xanthobacteraceae bacterium]
MSERVALKIAIDLMHVPSQVRLFRSEPLPEGVPLLLRIAAGDNEADRTAVELTGRSIDTVQRAAAFFIEQILFAPEADSYRVLGASRQASAAELRRNVGLLLKWLHPDVDPHSERSVFVGKVTGAWNNLKTPDRRAAYDELRRSQASRGRPKAWRRNQRKQLAAGMARQRGRDAPWTSSEAEGGFFRRALSALFHRPPQ